MSRGRPQTAIKAPSAEVKAFFEACESAPSPSSRCMPSCARRSNTHRATEPSKSGDGAPISKIRALRPVACHTSRPQGKMKPHPSKATSPRAPVPRPLTRSQVMARIRSRGNKATEAELASLLRQHRLKGWRRAARFRESPISYSPLTGLRSVWMDASDSGHPTMCRLPATNRDYWLPKIERNRARDRHINRNLRCAGLAHNTNLGAPPRREP